jgi:UDP-2-acetamido-3-amino-2,3-dideoxy-glucuronate N-acetyltransferase
MRHAARQAEAKAWWTLFRAQSASCSPVSTEDSAYVHPSAFVAQDAELGPGTKVWHLAQVREGARVGAECILGKGAYVGEGVHIGNRVKIQNGASIYPGATVEDGVLVGPHVCFTNDRYPRAVNADGSLKTAADWTVGTILVREGASLGAASVLIAGVTVGRWAMVAAGAVVSRDVPDFALVAGNPARRMGYVCACGHRLREAGEGRLVCESCGAAYRCDAGGAVTPA